MLHLADFRLSQELCFFTLPLGLLTAHAGTHLPESVEKLLLLGVPFEAVLRSVLLHRLGDIEPVKGAFIILSICAIGALLE